MAKSEKIYTIAEVAKLLKVSTSTVRNILIEKKMRHRRVGIQFQIPESAYKEYIESITINVPALNQPEA